MLGISLKEMLAIAIIGLVVLGPKDLPKVARYLAKGYRWLHNTTAEARAVLTRELDLEKAGLGDLAQEGRQTIAEVKSMAAENYGLGGELKQTITETQKAVAHELKP